MAEHEWLFLFELFTVLLSLSRIFHLYEDDTIASEGLQFCPISALRVFEQGGIFIMPHLAPAVT
jgi:hypothetical protein